MPPAAKKREGSSSVAAMRKGGRGGSGKQRSSSSSSSRAGAWWEGFKSIAGALVIFLFIRTFLVEAFRIPSGSMIPALLVGDWLFVNKLRYGPHIPFTRINLPGYADPQRGEIVVFESPPQYDQPHDLTPTLVKRLVGMPGDTLHMRDAMLYVNGIAQRQGYAAAANEPGADVVDSHFVWLDSAARVTRTRFGPAPARASHDNWGPLVVPARRYFMLGDNRYASKDSRYWGVVPRENVRGRPLFVYYSYNADDSDRALPFITDIRWSRLGHRIK